MRIIKFALFGTLGLIGAAALAAILGAVVMLLWNALLPALFGITAVTFWQAVGIVVLAKIFGGLLFGHRRHRMHPPHPRHWRKHRPFPPFGCGKPAESSS